MINYDLVSKVKNYSFDKHSKQKYGSQPYNFHLNNVYNYVVKYMDLLDDDNQITLAMCGSFAHDVIEDTEITEEEIANLFGYKFSVIIGELSKKDGLSLEDYFQNISESKIATFVKICDRLANVSYSFEKGSSILEKYRKEMPLFREKLYKPEFDVMFRELEKYFIK